MPKEDTQFKPGTPKPLNSGRKKGVPNKITVDVRRSLQQLAENLTPELESWIQRTARRSPEKAAQLLMTSLEFTQPKLQRTEVTGLDGGALEVSLSSKDEKA